MLYVKHVHVLLSGSAVGELAPFTSTKHESTHTNLRTRCLCDKPHHCTCTMSQASTWLTPQGDRVQRRSLNARHTYTPPFGQTRHAVSCIACMDIPAARKRCVSHHVTSLSCQYKCNACRLYTPHSLLYKLYKDRRSILLQKRTDTKPLPPQTTSFRF